MSCNHNCHSKAVKFGMIGELAFVFQGDRSDVPCNMISMLSARQLLRKRCHGFLAFVRDVEKEVDSLEQVPMVREYPNVFLEELPELPPNREVEFSIDVVPGNQTIFIPPYRMAPAELKGSCKSCWINVSSDPTPLLGVL